VNPDEKNEFIDSHLVAHDLTVVATSVVAGGVGTLVGGSAEGLLGAGVALAVGVTPDAPGDQPAGPQGRRGEFAAHPPAGLNDRNRHDLGRPGP
jgi:hypothetical protein